MTEADWGQLDLDEQIKLDDWPPRKCRNINCFQLLEKIGEGSQGEIYRAWDTETEEIVALKKIRKCSLTHSKFPHTAKREITILRYLQHDNVIELKEIIVSPGDNYYMVLECMKHDLRGLSMFCGEPFTVPQCIMKQLLQGLQYCHANRVIHRDIKGANILLSEEGILKLADFGLARRLPSADDSMLTNDVVTLWYRPPELLLQCGVPSKYGLAIDIWSAGCVFAELLHGKVAMKGMNEIDQLHKIFELCGSADEDNWPGVSKLMSRHRFPPMKRCVREVFECHGHDAVELLDRMLMLHPSKRISAKQALEADYFSAYPLPCDPKSLPQVESAISFVLRQKFEMQLQRQQRLPYSDHQSRLVHSVHGPALSQYRSHYGLQEGGGRHHLGHQGQLQRQVQQQSMPRSSMNWQLHSGLSLGLCQVPSELRPAIFKRHHKTGLSRNQSIQSPAPETTELHCEEPEGSGSHLGHGVEEGGGSFASSSRKQQHSPPNEASRVRSPKSPRR